MKKEIVLFAILCLMVLDITIAQEANETTKGINSAAMAVRYEIVKYGYEKTATAMTTVIDYFAGKGKNTNILESLKNNFSNEFEKLSSIADPSTFGKTVAEMHKIAADFKKETARLASPGEMGELKRMINLINESEKLEELKQNITTKKIQLYGKVCALNIERIQNFINKLSEKNVSITEINELKGKLEALKEECNSLNETEAELEQKIADVCNQTIRERAKIREMIVEKIREELPELNITNETKINEKIDALIGKCAEKTYKKEIRALINEIRAVRLNNRIENVNRISKGLETRSTEIAVGVNQRAMEKAMEVISKLQNKGVNVSQVNEKLQIVSNAMQNVSKECANITEANRKSCIEAVKEIGKEMRKTTEEISAIRRRGR